MTDKTVTAWKLIKYKMLDLKDSGIPDCCYHCHLNWSHQHPCPKLNHPCSHLNCLKFRIFKTFNNKDQLVTGPRHTYSNYSFSCYIRKPLCNTCSPSYTEIILFKKLLQSTLVCVEALDSNLFYNFYCLQLAHITWHCITKLPLLI
jgi:hypothetical protein